MEWIKIIRPPRVRTLPAIPTREEVQLLINTVRKLRYRIFLLVVYSLGLRITEGLSLEVADIDGTQRRVHIRDGKGGKDRYVPLPALALQAMRRFWSSHRHPRLLFSAVMKQSGNGSTPLLPGTTQNTVTVASSSSRRINGIRAKRRPSVKSAGAPTRRRIGSIPPAGAVISVAGNSLRWCALITLVPQNAWPECQVPVITGPPLCSMNSQRLLCRVNVANRHGSGGSVGHPGARYRRAGNPSPTSGPRSPWISDLWGSEIHGLRPGAGRTTLSRCPWSPPWHS